MHFHEIGLKKQLSFIQRFKLSKKKQFGADADIYMIKCKSIRSL